MSAKLKFLMLFTLSIFATAVVVGIDRIQRWHSNRLYNSKKQQQIQAKQNPNQKLVAYHSRIEYKAIPLTRFRTVLRGTDPAALAINAFDATQSQQLNRKVEVIYPQRDRAMVLITQTNLASSETKPIKYKVELTSLGRSLFVSSPPLWQIVWAGSSEQCLVSRNNTVPSAACR
ncbi:hypothetical protein Riv7116_2849 [Rivularia sp. PCC 7116]|nr:hypothetical protein Riv7116_2849 [Rivularia sp. PCC 7116]